MLWDGTLKTRETEDSRTHIQNAKRSTVQLGKTTKDRKLQKLVLKMNALGE